MMLHDDDTDDRRSRDDDEDRRPAPPAVVERRSGVETIIRWPGPWGWHLVLRGRRVAGRFVTTAAIEKTEIE
jgi:hypothetical protein